MTSVDTRPSGPRTFSIRILFKDGVPSRSIEWETDDIDADLTKFQLALERAHNRDRYVAELEKENAKLKSEIQTVRRFADELLKRNVLLKK